MLSFVVLAGILQLYTKLLPLVLEPKVPSTSTALKPAVVFEFVNPDTAFDAPNDNFPDTLIIENKYLLGRGITV